LTERLDKESNKAFYDSEREDDRRRFSTEPSKRHTAGLLVPWVASFLRQDDRLLDIAGGSGTYASEIVRAAPVSIVGVDLSESMIRQRGEDPRLLENVVGDMEALPFEDESFDAAMVVAALHHVPDPLPALREAHRVLRPGGRIFVFEPCSLRARRGRPRPVAGKPHEFAISASWLVRRIEEAGFEIEERRSHNLTIRAIAALVRSPSLSLYLAADRIDRIAGLIPGVAQLGTVVMVRARKAPQAAAAPFPRSSSQ
jgi:SAM-dependent methyltransferase